MKKCSALYKRYLLGAYVSLVFMLLTFIFTFYSDSFGYEVASEMRPYLYVVLFALAVLFSLFIFISISLKRVYLRIQYANDYQTSLRRVAVVAHVRPVSGATDNLSLSDVDGVRKWFISRFKSILPFEENASLSLDVYQGSSIDDPDLLYNLKKSLSNHSINDSHFVGFEAYNKESPVKISSSPLSEGVLEAGMTLVFITESSNLFYRDSLEDGLDLLLSNQDRHVVSLSKLFETHGISRPHIYLEKYSL